MLVCSKDLAHARKDYLISKGLDEEMEDEAQKIGAHLGVAPTEARANRRLPVSGSMYQGATVVHFHSMSHGHLRHLRHRWCSRIRIPQILPQRSEEKRLAEPLNRSLGASKVRHSDVGSLKHSKDSSVVACDILRVLTPNAWFLFHGMFSCQTCLLRGALLCACALFHVLQVSIPENNETTLTGFHPLQGGGSGRNQGARSSFSAFSALMGRSRLVPRSGQAKESRRPCKESGATPTAFFSGTDSPVPGIRWTWTRRGRTLCNRPVALGSWKGL